jgi:lysophospholipase L1-like esterase
MTLRERLPLTRAGARIRVAILSGDGPLQIHAANVALSTGPAGEIGPPQPLLFAGQLGATLGARRRIVSDPVALQVAAGNELGVTFAAAGTLAASVIANFPGSFVCPGCAVDDPNAKGGAWAVSGRLAGIGTVEIEGPSERAVVAIGDSITEGYVRGHVFPSGALRESAGYVPVDDYRNAWPSVASRIWGHPAANAGISGQGTQEAINHLADDVLVLSGEITDCVILLGTNDLSGTGTGVTVDQVTSNLQRLYATLTPICRVWAGTLIPKEWNPSRYTAAEYEVIRQERHAVNAWIRARTAADGLAGVIDFEAVTRLSSADVDTFGVDANGNSLGEDGVHPSVAGQHAMGVEGSRRLSAPAP